MNLMLMLMMMMIKTMTMIWADVLSRRHTKAKKKTKFVDEGIMNDEKNNVYLEYEYMYRCIEETPKMARTYRKPSHCRIFVKHHPFFLPFAP